MDSARFNVYWFLWLLSPAVIMMVAVLIWRRYVLIGAMILSVVLTYVFSNVAIIEKWNIRRATAVTEQQLEAATAAGANKVFTLYFFAPVEAVFLTWFWYWASRKAWGKRSNLMPND